MTNHFNLDQAEFVEKAKEICYQSFLAYFVENDMTKSCADMPADRFKSFCINTLHTKVDYKDFMEYILPTEEYDHHALVEDVQLIAPFATTKLCVIFLTAKVYFLIDNGYKIQFDVRISYVVVQNQGKLEILHLHFSMPHKNIRNIHLQEQDEDNNLYINSLSEQNTKGAATAAGMYSPNALIFYQISGKEQVNLVNTSLLKLLGYASNRDLQTHTGGCLERLVHPEDWPRVHQQLELRQQGRIFNLNASFLHKDGTAIRVLLRGNYVENHNKFFILSLTPLLIPSEQLTWDALPLAQPSSEDYSIPYELYLKIALDIFAQHGREKGIPHLLELATTVLNAHNGWVCDVRQRSTPIKLLRNYTVPGHKKLTPCNIPARCALYYYHMFSKLAYNSLEEMPHPLRDLCLQQGISSFMHCVISIDGQEGFILNFLRQEHTPPWTVNEKKIMYYTSKMFAILLDGYVQKHPLQSYLDGGAP